MEPHVKAHVQPVAAKHCLQVTEAHFEKAVQKAVQDTVQQAPAASRKESHGENEGERNLAPCVGLRNNTTARETVRSYREMSLVPPRGLEPLSSG